MEETMENQPNNNTMYYVLGAIVLVAVIAAGYLLRPKATTPGKTGQQAGVPAAVPTPGPISRLACDVQYYNPVLGFPKYFLSVEGGDVTGPSQVECTMTITQENRVVSTEKMTVPLTEKPDRGGNVFKCSSQALELRPTIPTKVDVSLKDDQGAKASCSAVFALPTT
jgi:hypothetical protein